MFQRGLVSLIVVGLGLSVMASIPGSAAQAAEPRGRPNPALTASDCHRLRVVWSGGVARRGPDRVAPLPVRSRWQRADSPRIRCPQAAGNAFKKVRVSDRPGIR